MGCVTCHRSDTQGRGPNLVGVFGKPVALEDGRTLTADENYLRQCILNSRGQVVKGYPAIMPVFQGLLSEEQVNSLVAYVKSLSGATTGASCEDRLRRYSTRSEGAIVMATAAITHERENYLNQEYGIRSWLLTMDHKRIALLVPDVDHVLLLYRRLLRAADPAGTAHAGGRPGARPTPTTSCSPCTGR